MPVADDELPLLDDDFEGDELDEEEDDDEALDAPEEDDPSDQSNPVDGL